MSRPRWLGVHWSSFVCRRVSPVTCWILGEILQPSSGRPGGGVSSLLTLLSSCFIMSSSCGSGLSGDYLSDEGHYWVGIDISPAMLGKMCYLVLELTTLHEYGAAMRRLFSWCIFVPCRCGLGPRHWGRPASGGHGPGHSLQTRHLWWLYQVRVFTSCLVLRVSAFQTGCAE